VSGEDHPCHQLDELRPSDPSRRPPSSSEDWLEDLAEQRQAACPTLAACEERVAAGGGYVVEVAVEEQGGRIVWVVVAEGGDCPLVAEEDKPPINADLAARLVGDSAEP